MLYKLSEDDLSKILNFAETNYMHFKNNNRSYKDQIKQIYRGKLGELAFDKMFELNQLNLGTNVDPGYDFKVNDITIDVKTILPESISICVNSLKADLVAVVCLDFYTKIVQNLGIASSIKIKEFIKNDRISVFDFDTHSNNTEIIMHKLKKDMQ